MILKGIEFESIWNVAHKWCNQNPDTSKPESLDPLVLERMMRIARAVLFKKLSLRKEDNTPILDSWVLINMIIDFRVFWGLRDTYFHQKIDKTLLDSHYISRAELLKWCSEEYLTFPQFWLEDNQFSKIPESEKVSPASRRDKAKSAYRALAEFIWSIDPRVHPKHIAESTVIQNLKTVDHYNADTVRDWIIDLDPQKDFRKSGAPPKTEYKINLKTGAISENTLPTYSEK